MLIAFIFVSIHTEGDMVRHGKNRLAGFTLIELLIVIAILVIVSLIFLLVNWKRSIYRASDARRKTDVTHIRRAFEEYYNDHSCYPALEVLDTCGGVGLAPYLGKIPCDPVTRLPYKYEPDSGVNLCLGNRVCAKLQDVGDSDITTLGCHPTNGCGWGAGWNYCLAMGTTVTAPGFISGATATPGPSPTPMYLGNYACTPGGSCNLYDNPAAHGCPVSFAENNCQGLCGNPAYRCLD